MTSPGLTPVPRTATPFSLALRSIWRAIGRWRSSAYESSSHVETMWKPASMASSICGRTAWRRDPVQSRTTSDFPRAAAESA